MDGMAQLTVFVLAVFLGHEVISKVSTTLHTPQQARRAVRSEKPLAANESLPAVICSALEVSQGTDGPFAGFPPVTPLVGRLWSALGVRGVGDGLGGGFGCLCGVVGGADAGELVGVGLPGRGGFGQ
jgi:4TM region of pyridine nucleotide transhydrogenase, mitoch